MDDLLSVIVSCYNNPETLGRALRSLYRQTRPADEIIVVDDHSDEPENITRVVREFPKVRYIRNDENLGAPSALNAGIKLATGNIITLLDSDDEAHPQRFEFQLRFLKRDSAVSCDKQFIRGKKKEEKLFSKAEVEVIKKVSSILFYNRLVGASLMISKDLLGRVGGYDVNLRNSYDFDLWLRLLDGGVTIRKVKLPLYIYYNSQNSLSKQYERVAKSEILVLDKYFKSKGEGYRASLFAGLVYSFWVLKHFARAAAYNSPVLFEQTRDELHLLDSRPWLRFVVSAMGRFPVKLFYLLARELT